MFVTYTPVKVLVNNKSWKSWNVETQKWPTLHFTSSANQFLDSKAKPTAKKDEK